jgi:hypothetical protein
MVKPSRALNLGQFGKVFWRRKPAQFFRCGIKDFLGKTMTAVFSGNQGLLFKSGCQRS